MRLTFQLLSLATIASAHTLFTTFFIDGDNQGDGTCVRMPEDGKTSTAPIYPLNGDVMACGRDGDKSVPFVCPASAGSTLTFEFRVYPNAEKPGSIDESHQGPCSVYVKKLDDMFGDSASGPGWVKIWEDGYDADNDKWCVDKLIDNKGLLSVDLPSGLPTGYYLVRPELIALHQAYRGDPQFFHSCAQVFINDGPEGSLDAPEDQVVSIPGYIKDDAPGLTFNLYEDDPKDYKIPGPKVFVPESSGAGSDHEQKDGAIPKNCALKNGNWCAKPVPRHSDVEGCWNSVDDCWAQSKKCWSSIPLTGGAGCEVWAEYCESLGDKCEAGEYDGPPAFDGEEQFAAVPGAIPKSYNNIFARTNMNLGKIVDNEEDNEGGDDDAEKPKPSFAPVPFPTESDKEHSETLKISEDGRCGGETGQTCNGSSFGNCCSKKGQCGRKTKQCTCGCQILFGECWE